MIMKDISYINIIYTYNYMKECEVLRRFLGSTSPFLINQLLPIAERVVTGGALQLKLHDSQGEELQEFGIDVEDIAAAEQRNETWKDLVEGLAQHRHHIHLSHKGLEAGALHADEQQKVIA